MSQAAEQSSTATPTIPPQPAPEWNCFTHCSLAPDAPPCPCLAGRETRFMSRPIAAADAALIALCAEFNCITDLIGKADANEVDIDDEQLGAAIRRYYCVCQEIANIDAKSEIGRRAKVGCAYTAMLKLDASAEPRVCGLVRSALSDQIASWIWGEQRP